MRRDLRRYITFTWPENANLRAAKATAEAGAQKAAARTAAEEAVQKGAPEAAAKEAIAQAAPAESETGPQRWPPQGRHTQRRLHSRQRRRTEGNVQCKI